MFVYFEDSSFLVCCIGHFCALDTLTPPVRILLVELATDYWRDDLVARCRHIDAEFLSITLIKGGEQRKSASWLDYRMPNASLTV